MGLDNGTQSASSEPQGRVSTRWIIVLIVLIIANLFIWLSGYFSVSVASLFSVLTVAILASGKFMLRYRRLMYILIVPGLLAWIFAAHGFYIAFTSGYGGALVRFFQRIAGESNGQILLAILLGLLVGVLTSIGILEGYVFIHQATIQAFSDLDAKAARRALRTLVLGINYLYFIVEDGKRTTSRPPGVFPKWGGPGIAVIRPGNAVVFQQGGEISHVALSGIYRAKRFEKIFKIINLTSRDNLSTPKQTVPSGTDVLLSSEENRSKSRPERNTRNVLTRDRIPLALDLKIFFQIKRKTSETEDLTLSAFTSGEDPGEKAKQLAKAYPVDQEDVFQAATAFNDWEAAVISIATDTLRDIVGQRRLDELFEVPTNKYEPPQIRGSICQELRDRLNDILNNYGVEVTFVSIGEVDLPDDIHSQIKERWFTDNKIQLARGQRDLKAVQSQTEADAMELVEAARTRAQTLMLNEISEIFAKFGSVDDIPRDVLWLQFIQALEQIAKDPSTKLLVPYGLPFEDIKHLEDSFEEKPSASHPRLPSGR